MPRTDKLAKITVANHVSIDWLASGRGPMRYDEEFLLHSDDATRATYLGDVPAAARVGVRVGELMDAGREAELTIARLAREVSVEVPVRWIGLLLQLLMHRQITEAGVRRFLVYLKDDLPGV